MNALSADFFFFFVFHLLPNKPSSKRLIVVDVAVLVVGANFAIGKKKTEATTNLAIGKKKTEAIVFF